jgi:hypothetical protein
MNPDVEWKIKRLLHDIDGVISSLFYGKITNGDATAKIGELTDEVRIQLSKAAKEAE